MMTTPKRLRARLDPAPAERCEYEIDDPVHGGKGQPRQNYTRPCARPSTGTWRDPNTGETIRFCTQHRNLVTARGYL